MKKLQTKLKSRKSCARGVWLSQKPAEHKQ